ncbi:hypothetical protein SASPL_133688 [Salvia splendens]|uniref:Uncharacterized protein n=1 Tax=Salvia splendens TaxID=180675 RepID=A0A8X8ZIK3_SALSN|nr:hypothetical protein SASPL_133688 [Salvia splendens]
MGKGAESVRPENRPESKQGASVQVGGGRVQIKVDLNPEETTIVSWTKILKRENLSKADGPDPSAPGPSFEACDDEQPTSPPAAPSQNNETNLHGSRDEEDLVLHDMPDEDDYNIDDSFIDDTELVCTALSSIRPPSTDPQDPVNQSHSGKKRLPSEIKLELAKVARIAGSCYRRIPKDVISRLMSILGHLMKIETLRFIVDVPTRNLQAMANAGLSAKQEKYDKILKMKQEVAEMVKSRAAGRKQKTQLQQFVAMQLASLWPDGFMNTNRIKHAIYRAKERKGIRSFQKVGGGRVRFMVELNPWKTTIVSWKKLLKEANLSEPEGPSPFAPGPSLEAHGMSMRSCHLVLRQLLV